ncbi:His Kinase A (phospho-acceptor) domain-containing protein [Marinitoga hydrogenitolerans DSM 16785]|uniref:histidine kinase n=1 Tax=Marinitoga hydrogenitolerans (strain DSM 16785 / JCM 12826 / AT1271) TaxID=1122195 RepID=A0A1M4Z1I5_MARH1|nr:ATP-binding protein [Marinitoga hydrogenitolerans]SHF11446.1 His Kinase A (phospho-acceptor) domain-containing protein [Marinitoga hydrogenitolerans DSM 16785]
MTLKRRFILIILILAIFPIITTIFNKIYITKNLFNELSEYTKTTIDDFGFEMVNKIYPTTINSFYDQQKMLKNFSKNILENQRIIDYAKYGLLNTLKIYINELLNSSDIDGVRIVVDGNKIIDIGDFAKIKDIEEGFFEDDNSIYMIAKYSKNNVSVFSSKRIDRYFLDSLNYSSISIISIIGKKHKLFQKQSFYKEFEIKDRFVISGNYKYPSKIYYLSKDLMLILSFDISQLNAIQNKIKDIFFENISLNLNTALIIWIILSPLLIYFALFYFGKDIGTLEQSIRAISKIAKGNFDTKIKLENKNNRYKELVESINILSENLINMKKEIENNIKNLEKEKNTLKYLVENLYEGIIFFDIDGSIKIKNSLGEEILKEIGDQEIKESNNRIYSLEMKGEQKLIEITRQYLNNGSFLVLIRDISLEKEMNNLYSLNEKLIEKEKFGRIAAHEIRNPLNSMYLNLQYLKMEFEGNKKIENISDIIIEQIKIIDSIVGELSSKAIIESEEKYININNVISQILNLLKYKLLENSIEIDFKKSHENILVKANPQRLNQLFYNIINNSIEALENKKGEKKINVNIDKNDEKIKIIIEDNGEGIPEELKNNVFKKPFTTKKYGNGIGLFIVHSIVKELNGEIKFESSKSGTKFILEFKSEEIL